MHAQFIQIPVELLSDRRVSALELRLYAILLRYGLEGEVSARLDIGYWHPTAAATSKP